MSTTKNMVITQDMKDKVLCILRDMEPPYVAVPTSYVVARAKRVTFPNRDYVRETLRKLRFIDQVIDSIHSPEGHLWFLP